MCRFAYEGEVIDDIVLYNLAKPLSSFYQEFMQFYMQSFTKTLLKSRDFYTEYDMSLPGSFKISP